MPVLASIIAAAASGKITPPVPLLTHSPTQAGYFTITNYEPTKYTYTRTDGIAITSSTVILSGSSANTIVRSTSPKGFSKSTYIEVAPYEYDCRKVADLCSPCGCYNPGWCTCLAPDAGGCPEGSTPNGQCGCGNTYPDYPCFIGEILPDVCPDECCTAQPDKCDVLKNKPGYINHESGEWYRVIQDVS